jgi:hypothetical protein
MTSEHPGILHGNATAEQWWKFAQKADTDNFGLHILAGEPCCNGTDTDPKYLDYAKALLSRFSIVLDMDCLKNGADAFADLLGLDIDSSIQESSLRTEQTFQELIPYPEVLDFLMQRNALDIELYKWSRGLGLVNCSSFEPPPTPASTSRPSLASTPKPTPTPAPVPLQQTSLPVVKTPEPTPPPVSKPTSAPVQVTPTEETARSDNTINELAQKQIDNYKAGNALLLNLAVLHQGEETLCNVIGHANDYETPPWYCVVRARDDVPEDYPKDKEWDYNSTSSNIAIVRQSFNYIAWLLEGPPEMPLSSPYYEDESLVSVIIMRDPLRYVGYSDRLCVSPLDLTLF